MAPTFPPIRLRFRLGQNSSIRSKLTTMTNIAVAEAKARFSELIDRAGRGERFLVLRHGRPAAAIVPAPPQQDEPEPARTTTGLAALAGIIDWDEFPAVMEEVIASRPFEKSRPAPTFD